jgi:hypothetical protein
MAIAIRQFKTATTASALGASPVVLTFDNDVLSGSLLVVCGVALDNDAYTFSNLSSVTDTRSNTWQSAVNQNAAGSCAVFYSYAMNATAGSTAVTCNLSDTTNNRYGIAVFEVTGALTSGALDLHVVGSASTLGTTVSTAATGTLDQADNITFIVAGGAFGDPENPAGYTEYLSVANGGTSIGAQISAKVVSATTTITGTVTHASVANTRHVLLAVFKQAPVTTYRYKFQFNTSQLTSADSGISGYVWRNTTPDAGVAETYTGLSGDATAGDLLVTGVPAGVALTDSVTGIFYNGTDTSGLVSGSVEEV